MKTEILCITDRSGSMASMVSEVIGGYNAFLAAQKDVPGEAKVTFAQFNDRYDLVYEGVPLAHAPYLDRETYVPRHGTALYDAIGRTLNEQGERIARANWAEKVIVCIITDGEENASQKFDGEQIRNMITHAEKNGWSFVFLAANQDAFKTGASMGISGATTANYDAHAKGGTLRAYAATSQMVAELRAAPMDPALAKFDMLAQAEQIGQVTLTDAAN